jgi:hypothetical protein
VREAFEGLKFKNDTGGDFDLYSEIWLTTFKEKVKDCKFIPIASALRSGIF